MRIQRHVRVIYSTDQCGYRDTFGLYILQINADTETRSGYIFYRSMRIQRHVRVIYSTDQCGYRDTFGLYITRCIGLGVTLTLALTLTPRDLGVNSGGFFQDRFHAIRVVIPWRVIFACGHSWLRDLRVWSFLAA